MTDVAAEKGGANVTVADVVARAGVSRRTFYEIFDDREGCFLAALDSALERASERVVEAYDPAARWQDRVRRALVALLSFLDENPAAGRLAVVESLGAGPRALARRASAHLRVVAAIDEGRAEGRGSSDSLPLTAEATAGAVLSLIHARMVEGDGRPLIELTSPLMSTIVLPYLGPAAARREMERPVPAPLRSSRHEEPLKGLEMRLTYRTIRVLLAIGANPGASNRQVGAVSGAEDQGQISKLLARLERLGLIQNTGMGSSKGGCNEWTLTERGHEVRGAIAASSAPGA
jgi:AcrR family transcriptional regulator/DNA-binding MarR family transcriptional regulator